MRWIPRTAQRSIIHRIALSTFAAMLMYPVSPLPAQAPRSRVRLPDEAAGIDGIAQTLISVFDQADIVALGEAHGRRADSDLRIALVRHPDFAKKVRAIVVEFGSATEQSTLDRYIRGENVSRAQLEQVWKTTSNGVWDSPIYTEFFAAVRDVNSKLHADARIRVFGGDPGPTDQRDRETAAVAVLEEQVLSKHGKALVIYGAAHFYRAAPASFGTSADLARRLEKAHPGRIFTVIPIGGDLDPPPPGVSQLNPDDDRWAARAGWNLTAERIARSPDGIDVPALLDRIESEMGTAASEVQWTMNSCLAGIGIHFPKLRQRAIAIGDKLGIYRDYPVSKGCTSPFAPIWINEMVRRQK